MPWGLWVFIVCGSHSNFSAANAAAEEQLDLSQRPRIWWRWRGSGELLQKEESDSQDEGTQYQCPKHGTKGNAEH